MLNVNLRSTGNHGLVQNIAMRSVVIRTYGVLRTYVQQRASRVIYEMIAGKDYCLSVQRNDRTSTIRQLMINPRGNQSTA